MKSLKTVDTTKTNVEIERNQLFQVSNNSLTMRLACLHGKESIVVAHSVNSLISSGGGHINTRERGKCPSLLSLEDF